MLNSKVLTFRYRSIGKKTGNNSYEYFSIGISKLPIPEISLEEQKPFIELADKMLELKRCLIDKKNSSRDKVIREANYMDKQINQLVYELYNLTDEEIEIIENSLD